MARWWRDGRYIVVRCGWECALVATAMASSCWDLRRMKAGKAAFIAMLAIKEFANDRYLNAAIQPAKNSVHEPPYKGEIRIF